MKLARGIEWRNCMSDRNVSRLDLEQALGRFPGDSVMIRRLFLADPGFRSLCEDYRLAAEALAGFRRRPDAAVRPEIGDYCRVMAELEAEIAALIQSKRKTG
jgi:hypothetical protein